MNNRSISHRSRYGYAQMIHKTFGDFRCISCGNLVLANKQLSGVHNRNHCPYCLCSRHLDLYKHGDRLAACKACMRPIGLAAKRSFKKYSSGLSGELLLVHQCIDCGKLSLNRIAADDDDQKLLTIFESSLSLPPSMRRRLKENDIILLHTRDLDFVRARLFGIN